MYMSFSLWSTKSFQKIDATQKLSPIMKAATPTLSSARRDRKMSDNKQGIPCCKSYKNGHVMHKCPINIEREEQNTNETRSEEEISGFEPGKRK